MNKILLLLLLSAPCFSAISLVDKEFGNFPNTANGTIQLNLGNATSAGDALLVVCEVAGTSSNGVASITDSNGDTFSSVIWNNVRPVTAGNYYASYQLNTVAGITTVTAQENANAGGGGFWVYHVSGLPTSGALDTNSSPSGPTTSPWSSTGINTAIPSEILIGFSQGIFNGGNSNMTLTGGWLLGSVDNSNAGNGGQSISGYQIVSTQQIGVQFTGTDAAAGSANHYAGIIAFEGLATGQSSAVHGMTINGGRMVISGSRVIMQ